MKNFKVFVCKRLSVATATLLAFSPNVALARHAEEADSGGGALLLIPLGLACLLGFKFGKFGAISGAAVGLLICFVYPTFGYFILSLGLGVLFGLLIPYETMTQGGDIAETIMYFLFLGLPGLFFTVFILKKW